MSLYLKRQDGEIVEITMMDFRRAPGEVIAAVKRGVSFVVTHMGKQVAVIQSPEKSDLTLHALPSGKMTYLPPQLADSKEGI